MKHGKIIIIFSTVILMTANISAQTGGDFTITQSVIASGGGQQTTGGTFSLDGTGGQSLAGGALSGSPFAVTSGFWHFNVLAPTAAGVNIGGRVTTAGGRGIRNVMLTLISAGTGEIFYARSGLFGSYRFEDIPAGQTYVLTVSARRFLFVPNTQIIMLLKELTNVNFVGTAQF